MGTYRQPGIGFALVNEGREIVSIEWHSRRPGWHELTYDDGDVKRVLGDLKEAAGLAEALKLALVTEGVVLVRWERKGG